MIIFILFLIVLYVQSFADFMTKQMCHRKLEVDQFIMGHKVKSSNERFIIVTRDGEQLTSGDTYKIGETLEIDLSVVKLKGDHLFQSSSIDATFEGGGCKGVRLAKNSFARKLKGNLTIAMNATDSIILIAGK